MLRNIILCLVVALTTNAQAHHISGASFGSSSSTSGAVATLKKGEFFVQYIGGKWWFKDFNFQEIGAKNYHLQLWLLQSLHLNQIQGSYGLSKKITLTLEVNNTGYKLTEYRLLYNQRFFDEGIELNLSTLACYMHWQLPIQQKKISSVLVFGTRLPLLSKQDLTVSQIQGSLSNQIVLGNSWQYSFRKMSLQLSTWYQLNSNRVNEIKPGNFASIRLALERRLFEGKKAALWLMAGAWFEKQQMFKINDLLFNHSGYLGSYLNLGIRYEFKKKLMIRANTQLPIIEEPNGIQNQIRNRVNVGLSFLINTKQKK